MLRIGRRAAVAAVLSCSLARAAMLAAAAGTGTLIGKRLRRRKSGGR